MMKYEPPVSIDLSKTSAKGQVAPEGVCSAGSAPYTTCRTGSNVPSGACSAGSFVANCSPGAGVVENPQCRGGSNALTGCITGGQAG